MTRTVRAQTDFTQGELDPRLWGRVDLNLYENGAKTLTNVVIEPTGGVSRRPGLAHEVAVPGARRLFAYDDGGDGFLVAIGGGRIRKVENGAVTSDIQAPWTDQQVDELTSTTMREGSMFCHVDYPPRVLSLESDGDLRLDPIFWRENDAGDQKQPYARFADPDVTITPSAAGIGASDPIPASISISLTTSADFFSTRHIGYGLRVQGSLVIVSTVLDAKRAIAATRREIPNGETTRNWDEAAFSDARGWPGAVTSHQNRLVFAGSRDRPDQIWMSKIGEPYDFDTGEGLDDEAIVFRLIDDRQHRIRALHSGRDLQVFTDAGEWAVATDSNAPLTPLSASVRQQTRIGVAAEVGKRIESVDGATLFLAADGRELREFVFADAQSAYQAIDIAAYSRHLLVAPRAMAFFRPRRLLFVVRGDGEIAALTIDRVNDVFGWSRLKTDGEFLDALALTDRCYFLVERNGEARVERLADELSTDAGRRLVDQAPRSAWAGFDHLVGREVDILADDAPLNRLALQTPALSTGVQSLSIEVGLPFEIEIAPLPLATSGSAHRPHHPYIIGFRVQRADRVRVDLGLGFLDLQPDPATDSALALDDLAFEGDVRARMVGWRRGFADATWRIRDDRPRAFELLSATLETKVIN